MKGTKFSKQYIMKGRALQNLSESLKTRRRIWNVEERG